MFRFVIVAGLAAAVTAEITKHVRFVHRLQPVSIVPVRLNSLRHPSRRRSWSWKRLSRQKATSTSPPVALFKRPIIRSRVEPWQSTTTPKPSTSPATPTAASAMAVRPRASIVQRDRSRLTAVVATTDAVCCVAVGTCDAMISSNLDYYEGGCHSLSSSKRSFAQSASPPTTEGCTSTIVVADDQTNCEATCGMSRYGTREDQCNPTSAGTSAGAKCSGAGGASGTCDSTIAVVSDSTLCTLAAGSGGAGGSCAASSAGTTAGATCTYLPVRPAPNISNLITVFWGT